MGEAGILQTVYLGNTVQDYLISVGVFILSLFVLQIIKSVIFIKITALADKTSNRWDDVLCEMLDSLGWPFYFVIALETSVRFVTLEPFIHQLIGALTLIVVTFYSIRALQYVLLNSLNILLRKQSTEELPDQTILNFFQNAIKAALWVGGVIIILQNLGYEVGALLGGLGIAGIAIAFALQNVLEDIFSFFSIYFDKPFKKGDFIIVGKDMGTVEHIGIKSTRIMTLQGQELVVSNRELTQVRVNNYKHMERRRVVFSFGIIYETPSEKVKKIPDMVKAIIEREELADFDRAHFHEFGNFSLDFEVVYYVKNQDYNDYMDTQQSINLALMDQFEKEGIEFAYPTNVVYVKK